MTLSLQKGVNISRLTTLLCNFCLQGGPLAGVWNVDLGRASTIPRTGKRGSLRLNYTNNVFYDKHVFSFQESRIFVYAGQRLPIWPILNKIHKTPWLAAVPICCHTRWGNYVCPLWRQWDIFWKRAPGFPQFSPLVLFPLLILLCILPL